MSNKQLHLQNDALMAAGRAPHGDGNGIYRKEAILFSAYSILYIAYLFFLQENEFLHWVSLVFIPSVLLIAIQRRLNPSKWSIQNTLTSIGLSKSNMKNGILLAIILGFGFGAIQLLVSDDKHAILDQISSGKIFISLPFAFVFMLITAGFTEEFFFRGVMQTRLVKASNSRLFGIAAASIMFALYHLPYAYLNPDWPSYGDLTAALVTVLSEAFLIGIILGVLFEKTKNNLLSCIVLHSLFNAWPAAAMLKM